MSSLKGGVNQLSWRVMEIRLDDERITNKNDKNKRRDKGHQNVIFAHLDHFVPHCRKLFFLIWQEVDDPWWKLVNSPFL